MRIAFLTTEYPTESTFAGGLASYVHRTARVLSQTGHEVEVFTVSAQRETRRNEGILVHRVSAASRLEAAVRKLRVLPRYYGLSRIVGRSLNLARALKQRHREAPFEIVQAASCMGCGLAASLRPVVPLVTRVSSYMPAWREADNAETTATDRHSDWAQVVQMRHSAAVYAPSGLVAKLVTAKEGIPVEVLEPPFDRGYLDRVPLECPPGEAHESYALFFGSIRRMKGCDRLLRVIPDLLDRNPDFRFVFVGNISKTPGAADFTRDLETLVNYGKGRVKLLPAQRHEQLFRYVRHARFVVLPSRVDNLPNTCLEAMALGRPVIGTEGASFDQLITHGENGYFAPQLDDLALSSLMEQLWRSPATLRERVGQAASATVQRLEPSRSVEQLVGLFQRVIDVSSRRRHLRLTRNALEAKSSEAVAAR